MKPGKFVLQAATFAAGLLISISAGICAPVSPPGEPTGTGGPAAPSSHVRELSSALYDIALTSYTLPGQQGPRGSIARIENGLIYMSYLGKLYYGSTVDGVAPFVALGKDVEFNPDEPALKRFRPQWVTTLDIAAKKNARGGYDLFASHIAGDNRNNCFFIRVVRNEIDDFVDGVPVLKGDWQPFYDTRPCAPIADIDPTLLSLAGGRFAFLGDDLLMTVGTFGWDRAENGAVTAQDKGIDFGKILRFPGRRNTREVFSVGHRNAQGLFVADDGVIYVSGVSTNETISA